MILRNALLEVRAYFLGDGVSRPIRRALKRSRAYVMSSMRPFSTAKSHSARRSAVAVGGTSAIGTISPAGASS